VDQLRAFRPEHVDHLRRLRERTSEVPGIEEDLARQQEELREGDVVAEAIGVDDREEELRDGERERQREERRRPSPSKGEQLANHAAAVPPPAWQRTQRDDEKRRGDDERRARPEERPGDPHRPAGHERPERQRQRERQARLHPRQQRVSDEREADYDGGRHGPKYERTA